MAKKSKMDRGLDSLFFDNSIDEIARSDSESVKNDDGENGISTVRISLIEPDKNQPRSEFDEDALNELAENIRQHGVLQPILVRPLDNGGYKIVAGERRWRAARLAGLDEIPVYIKELTDLEAAEISLIENIQRENLNPIEEAIAYKRLLNEFNLKQDEVAERVSKSRTAVTNSMRLLKLCDKVQQMVIDDMISTGHARALLGITDEEKQYTLAQKIFDEKISVRDTEKLVKKMQKQKNAPAKEVNPEKKKLDAVYQEAEEKMKTITTELKAQFEESHKLEEEIKKNLEAIGYGI